MKNQMYTKEGWLDVESIMKTDAQPYKFIVGARGIGKTYGILKYILKYKIKFIYMRRTQTQVDLIKNDDLNPFKALEGELDEGLFYTFRNVNKYVTGVYLVDDVLGEYGSPIGYIMALSTVSNIRGFDASDVKLLVYDEFIGEKHEKPIRSEGTAFLNALETIGRNRELKGQPPLQVVALSNSTNLSNPIFLELKIITQCEKLIKKGNDLITLKDRGISIYLPINSPISSKKRQTALYRLAGSDSSFSQMALDNEFNQEYFGQVKRRSLTEFTPIVKVGEITIWKHKSRREWYVTEISAGSPEVYDSSEIELARFRNDYYYMKLAYLNRHVFFVSYVQQVLFEKYLNI